MEKKVFYTEISSRRGNVAIHQDSNFMYHKYRLDNIIFFTMKNGEYAKLGQIPAFNKEFYFTLKIEKLDKVPVKRVEKPKKEQFFFINSTMYICAEAIDLIGPSYKKVDRKPEFLSPSLTETNFALQESWTWNNGFFSREVMWDTQDYNDLRSDMQQKLSELTYGSYCFYTLNNMEKAINVIQDIKNKIQSRMDWWANASVDNLVSYYQSKMKGGKKNV